MNKSHTIIPKGCIEKSSFSSNCKEYSFKDFCDITSSKRIFYREYVKSGIPFYRSKEIIAKSNGKELSDCLYISKDRFEEIKNKYGIPINGDILITAVGTYGIPYLINEDGDFYFKDGNLIWLKNIKDVADSNFLFYWFKSEEAKNKVEGIIIGSVQKALTIDAMKNIKINLPPLAEQKRIASILSSFDDKIELNNKTNKILEEMAQTIFKEWFINFNFPNEDGKPYKKSGGEMIDSELGKIPKGWKVGTIGDIAREVICGKTPPTKDKENYGSYMPFITIPDMHNNIYVVKTERYLSKKGVNTQSKKTIPKNSICVSCIATVGVVSLVSEYSQTNQQINSIIPKGKVSSYWVYFYIKNIKDMIINYASSGTTTLNLNKSQFEKIKIIIPSDNLFMSFNEIAKSLFDMIINNQIENEKLSNIRDSLLPKLMTPKGRRADGEIRV